MPETRETTNAIATRNRSALPSGGVYAPRVDVVETADELILYADLPGARAEDVSLDYQDGELVLRARCAPRHADRRAVHAEYGVGHYHRAFRVTEPVEAGRIDAAMRDGVLAVRLPKAEAAKPKRIAVKEG